MGVKQCRNRLQLIHTIGAGLRSRHKLHQTGNCRRTCVASGVHEAHDNLCLLRRQPCALRKVAAVVLTAFPQQRADAVGAETIQLVDGAQHDAALAGEFVRIGGVEDTSNFHHTIQNFAVVDADFVIPTRDANDLKRVRKHRANLCISGHGRRTDRIRIALIKLAKPPRPWLLIAPHRTHRIATIGCGQIIAELRIDPRQRCGQVIAQGEPIVVFFPCEHTLIRAVHIGQELAQRFNRFNSRAFQRLEPIVMVHIGDLAEHCAALRDFRTKIVAEPFRGLRLWAGLLFDLGHVSS